MTLVIKDNRKVSMICDREGLIDMVSLITHLEPNELNTMVMTAAKRLVNGQKVWTWRLDYVTNVGKKL